MYYGYTCGLKKRVKEHNDRESTYTKGKTPWKLIYYETYINKLDAMKREKFLKSGRGREIIQKHLENTLYS